MKLIHYIDIDYTDGFYGGVPRFDYELHQIFPDIETRTKKRHGPPSGSLGEDVIVITGNDLCLDIHPDDKCIAVHHGIARTHKYNDPLWKGDHYVGGQNRMINRPNTYFVGCSTFCKTEFKRWYDVEDWKVILHGVRTNKNGAFIPSRNSKTILGDWRSHTKSGGGLIQRLMVGSPLIFKQLGHHLYNKVEGYRDVGVYFCPSLHEGNSYSMLDAIACNIPVLATNVGLFGGDFDDRVGKVFSWQAVNDDMTMKALLASILEDYDQYSPREWMEETCSYDMWTKQWHDAVEEMATMPLEKV